MATNGPANHRNGTSVMTGIPRQQAELSGRPVTSAGRRPGTPAAKRKRLQRERDKLLVYETEDWRLFIDLATLP